MKAFALFVGGTVAGYLTILFGWIAYAYLVQEFDGDSGKIMGIVFMIAPAGGLLSGLALMLLFGRRRSSPASPCRQVFRNN